jgi:hypothetical protein
MAAFGPIRGVMMGAKTWMLVYSNGNAKERLRASPKLDRSASTRLAQSLFPTAQLRPIEDGDLSYTNPPEDEIFVGCFPGVAVVAAEEFGLDQPSTLPSSFLSSELGSTVYLHAMHSVVDWFAFAIWEKGKLIRSLSLAPDHGILEDIGPRLEFEGPYWMGQHPVGEPGDDPPYAFPFHPLELGEAALKKLLGYQLEGMVDSTLITPWEIPLLRFKR